MNDDDNFYYLGPRGAMIFYRKGIRNVTKKGETVMYDLESKINFSGLGYL